MSQTPEQYHKLHPEYWDGHDIFKPELSEAQLNVREHLNFNKYKQATEWLHHGLGQVAAGNATEIPYRAGNEFNPDLEEGSLVVIDSEKLERWTGTDPEKKFDGQGIEASNLTFSRPYSDYWLNNQDGETQPGTGLGSQWIIFNEQNTIYSRALWWGVIVKQNNIRFVQPFLFRVVKLLPNGSVHTPTPSKKQVTPRSAAEQMPINIGKVEVGEHVIFEEDVHATNSLGRMRSIDVVYLASANKQPTRSPKRALGKLALPKLGLHSA